MIKLSRYVLGKKSLIILKSRVKRQGIDLRPEEFSGKITKYSQLIGCSREELLDFHRKFLIPEVMSSCQMRVDTDMSEPSEEEARIAFRLLKIRHFWGIEGLRDLAFDISNKNPISFEEVAAIASYIAHKHIDDQFGEGDAVKLQITD